MKYLLGVLLSLILVGNCYGFETGTWKSSDKSTEMSGEIIVKKSGSGYSTNMWVSVPSRPNFDGGICEENLKSRDVNKELQVFHDNKVSFIFKKEGKSYRMIPKDMSGYSHCGDPLDFDNEDLMKLRWKKVK